MKIYIIAVLLIYSCSSDGNRNIVNGVKGNESETAICNEQEMTEILKILSTKFEARKLELDSSLIQDKGINLFLDTVNKTCLKKQVYFRNFITIILLKQYYYHIINFHQSYNLLPMRNGSAKFIIDEFCSISHLDPIHTEMISSGYVVNYVGANLDLQNDSDIHRLITKIKVAEKNLKF